MRLLQQIALRVGRAPTARTFYRYTFILHDSPLPVKHFDRQFARVDVVLRRRAIPRLPDVGHGLFGGSFAGAVLVLKRRGEVGFCRAILVVLLRLGIKVNPV